ncbi:MAG: HupE/UreJ family protein [Bacteroidetes bacterium]|jgi:hydrogenase/urease accessory protein HupE|nr:HupE/UreJ family protein [Bacteroidota bacterium]
MQTFVLFFKQGLSHILDLDGIDHLLFILAITVFFSLSQWRKLALLITAFTIGHSITLVLSVYDIFTLPRDIIEQLIPITIIVTCINNFIKVYKPTQINYQLLYTTVLIFGCIHGLAFSNFLKMAFFEDDNLLASLVGFNIGIELGQLIIVGVFLAAIQMAFRGFKKLKHEHVIISCSAIILIFAVKILWDLL